MKLLVVDDSNFTINVLDSYLSKNYPDATILNAKTGEEALQTYEYEKPDIIITDIMLPDINGVILIKKIIEKNPAAKIIAISSEEDIGKEALSAGAKFFLKKPLASHKIFEALDSLIG